MILLTDLLAEAQIHDFSAWRKTVEVRYKFTHACPLLITLKEPFKEAVEQAQEVDENISMWLLHIGGHVTKTSDCQPTG